MPIQLDRILANIAEEKVLHPNYPDASKKDMDEAWMRVGKNNKLSVHEARSIFKVLQKKYEQEKSKGTSAWKLFNIMEQIHRKVEKTDIKTEEELEVPMEEDEEYEMLEVQEDEEQTGLTGHQSHTSGSASDNESPSKSMKSNCSPEKEEKPPTKTVGQVTIKQQASTNNATSCAPEEKKLLNTMASTTPRPPPHSTPSQSSSATAAALHKKGITVKKTINTTTPTATSSPGTMNSSGINVRLQSGGTSAQIKNTTVRGGGSVLEVGKTIQLPESIKRKLSEEHQASTNTQMKKIINMGQSIQTSTTQSPGGTSSNSAKALSSQVGHTTTAQLMQVKRDREDEIAQQTGVHGINLITIPANPRGDLTNGGAVGAGGGGASSSTAATVASTSTNGFSPRIEDIDFRNDIIFDSGSVSGMVNGNTANKPNTNGSEIINLGNFDNSLPPTFFKNLCNSSRHEALGLYVANVMNRLRSRSAAKLELAILRAIIDVQGDELEQ